MAKNDESTVISKEEASEKLTSDAFLVRAIFEMIGKPKKHVESTIKDYVKRFSETETCYLISYELNDAEKYEGSEDLYSTFAEVEFVAKDQIALLNFCVDFMPASVEVMEPDRLSIDAPYISNMLTELVGRMHLIDGEFKKVVAKNNALTQSFNIMTQNAILILLNMGAKTDEQIADVIGVKKENIGTYLEKLVQDKKIEKEKETYKLVKK